MKNNLFEVLPPLTAFIALFLLFLRFSSGIGSLDEVDFVLGVQEFDLFAMHPHFPGYPFFMLPAHFLDNYFHNPVMSLSILSLTGVAGSLILIYGTTLRLQQSPGLAIIPLGLALMSPLVLSLAARPMSDGFGTFWVIFSICLLLMVPHTKNSHRIFLFSLAGFCLGIALGVRISLFPFILSYLGIGMVYLRLRLLKSSELALGAWIMVTVCGIWLLWLISATEGPGNLLNLGYRFVKGHFSDWGNTVLCSGKLEVNQIVRGLFLFGLGIKGLWVAVVWLWIVVFLAVGFWLKIIPFKRLEAMTWAWMICPYAVWVFMGQNLDNLRHLLPLILLLLLWLGLYLPELALKEVLSLMITILALSHIGSSLKAIPIPPAEQLLKYMRAQCHPQEIVLFDHWIKRSFELSAPEYDVHIERRLSDVEKTLAIYTIRPKEVFLTGEVIGDEGRFKPLARFEPNGPLKAIYQPINLYKLN